ncbi:MAG: hypothetical protein MUE69_31975, partial [Myxococcota bacterium]|nr:hypothetical protein [Myxococcota bacterium]
MSSDRPQSIPAGHGGFDPLFACVRRMKLSGNAKVIFAWLRKIVADLDYHPGIRVIAKECGVARASAARALGELDRAGLITIEGSHGERPRYS